MKPNLKKLLPFVGLAALTALGTVGILKKDKIDQKSYKHQIKKENITTYD